MTRYSRAVFAAILLTFALAGAASAEITLTVNDNGAGLFDQPSAVPDGNTVHLAFIGDEAASGIYKVYYAAVNGRFNFQITAPPADNSYLLTRPTLVDNSTFPNDAYYDARHPKILVRNSTEAVILFQARPTVDNNVYRPYIARVKYSGNTVTQITVRQIIFPAGILDAADIEDLSFGVVASDNSARIAFGTKSAIGAAESFQVYFARVGLDDATVVGTPILLSSLAGTGGLRPLPGLKLDTTNRAHVAWVANNDAPVAAPVYYAMIKETNGIDNMVIQATPVLSRGLRWGFPSVHAFNKSSIVVLAVDETVAGRPGNIGLVNINPDADDQDGDPVQVAINTKFFLTPPGELILPDEFNLYHPDALLDSSGRMHVVGYGLDDTLCYQFGFHLITTSPYFEILTPPAQVGLGTRDFPRELAGDYTRAAFAFMSAGKVVVFWSGEIDAASRNIDVSTAATTASLSPESESGCSMVADPRSGDPGRMAGAAFLFLPVAILGARRISRRIRKARGSGVD